ncbi:MAG: FCD domain-containing protein [Proteobacteria bacterium]|nr:FCD domain-containing protein [Pseudomonadota bacterium]
MPPRLRLSDAISEQIERLIVDGALAPGAPLPSERDLAARLAVSRPSLREALLKMEARGLIHVRRGGGFVITDVSGPLVAEPLAHLLGRHSKAADDVLEMRHGLEATAAFFAAQRATTADLRKLEKAFAAMAKKQTHADSIADAAADAAFHLAVAEASHNVALVHVTRGVFTLMRSNIARTHDLLYGDAGNLHRLVDQHRAIFEAIRKHDPKSAQAAAHAHLAFVQETLRNLNGRLKEI